MSINVSKGYIHATNKISIIMNILVLNFTNILKILININRYFDKNIDKIKLIKNKK